MQIGTQRFAAIVVKVPRAELPSLKTKSDYNDSTTLKKGIILWSTLQLKKLLSNGMYPIE